MVTAVTISATVSIVAFFYAVVVTILTPAIAVSKEVATVVASALTDEINEMKK